jgi:hypothetical protein
VGRHGAGRLTLDVVIPGGAARPVAERRRVLSYEAAVHMAARRFARHGALDMQALADDLSVGRATLYRVVGGRERLLADVLWVLSARTLRMAADSTRSSGVDRFVEISRRFHDLVLAFDPLRRFTEEEPELAFRLLFMPAAGVHQRVVAWWADTLRRAAADGDVALPFAADELAEMFVRLGESMLWSELIAGRQVDVALWERVRRALFDRPETSSGAMPARTTGENASGCRATRSDDQSDRRQRAS